jgi:hypothetical protein
MNARLGWWIQNPAAIPRTGAQKFWWPLLGYTKEWTAAPPLQGAFWYLMELFGYTRDDELYLHLSDGGHFENTGAYELIRRRCRYVVIVDAAEDPFDASENLANLIQKVRADFGITINIETSPLRISEKGLSTAHCAIGVIRYDDVDEFGVTGTLVFIRSSLTGDEDADIRNYAATHQNFPHDSTSDQFFDEVQFESYRQLGFHIGMSVFRESVDEIGRDSVINYNSFNRQLFAHLRRQWIPVTNKQEGYLTSCRDYLNVTKDLRDTASLHKLSADLFPELRYLSSTPAKSKIAELTSDPDMDVRDAADDPIADLHAVDYLLQVMELAWIENELENQYSNHINRGWMNVFRRWSASETFHKYWPILRGQYSRGFVRFCERALDLDRLPVQWCRFSNIPDDVGIQIMKDFDNEFYREWAMVLRTTDRMKEKETCLSWALSHVEIAEEKPLGWVITTGLGEDDPGPIGTWKPHNLPMGLVIVFKHPPQDEDADGKKKVTDENSDFWSGKRELLVWIRGSHRTLGLARESVPKLFDEIIRPHIETSELKNLNATFPLLGNNMAARLHRTLWEWFFFDLGFVRDRKNDSEETKETRLVFGSK